MPDIKCAPTMYWLRSPCSATLVYYVSYYGDVRAYNPNSTSLAARPAMRLNLESIISARSASPNFGNITSVQNCMGNFYHTIEFGSYPSSKEDNSIDQNLKDLLHKKQLPSTSKIYPKYYQNGTFAKNEEYF